MTSCASFPGFEVATIFFTCQVAQQLARVFVAERLDHFGGCRRRGVEHGVYSAEIPVATNARKRLPRSQEPRRNAAIRGWCIFWKTV